MSEARARLDTLPAQYPRLFPRGPLHWGFEVGDGWSDIIVALCARINALLEESPGASLSVKQVKEKFGGLRFYYDLRGANESLIIALDEAVDLAEAACGHACERCGRLGSLDDRSGWLSTLCEACRLDLSQSR
jgi:hypothetical protein